jgi:signal peptidase I
MDKNNVFSPEQMLRQIKQRKFYLAARPWIRVSMVFILIAVLIIGIAMIPYVCMYGTAMAPTLSDGDFGIAFPAKEYRSGDIIAFRQNEKVLIRRIIACSGSSVSIDENGIVTVDGVILDEPYTAQKALGQCNIQFPYIVPDGQYFVLGDNRANAVDSRSTVLGCISKDAIIGRLNVIFWPFTRFQWEPSDRIGGSV